MKLINLTPHTINIFDNENNETVVEPSGLVARINTTSKQTGWINGFPIFKTVVDGDPYIVNADINMLDLPEMNDGIIYIVSGLFRSHCPRDDFYQPGKLIRDNTGSPIGCLGLSQ